MTSRPQLTSQQAAAITTKQVSIALSAGAGCGKTFVLTQRFLEGLEPVDAADGPVDLHSLVAITFTDRAAREMRDRIRAACQNRLQHCAHHEVDHWLTILRGLDAARISTIHSFCTSLLRSQAVEAGLDPRFTLLEPALTDTLLRRTVRDRLHQLIETRNDDAMQFVVLFGLERAQDLLRSLTRQRFQIDFEQFSQMMPDVLAQQWHDQWLTECVPTLVSKFRNSDLIERVLDSISGSPTRHETMKDRIAYLSSVLSPEMPWKDHLATLNEIHEAARIQGGGGKKDWESEERQEQVKQALDKLRKIVAALKEQLAIRQEDIVPAAELCCRALRLTQLTASDYAAAKQAQGVLDFDDLLLHARNLLKNNADVRRRIAAGIRLLMVDEFQDTDPVQADIVRSLCGAALQHGKLFMVGDRKQSIYRFRRADPTVFLTMSDELPPQGRLPLSINFRSQPAILNFVNRLFGPAMEGYEPLIPFQSEQFSPTPAIEFLFASFDAAEFAPEPSHATPDEDDSRPNASQIRAREADWMARRIVSLLEDPTPRIRTKKQSPDGRPVLRRTEPGDIVILFRALTSVQTYEAAFERYGLEYYLVGGKAFFAQQEVFDLLNLCRYLDDCDDLVGLVGVLRSPFFNLSDDALQALAFHTDSNSVNDDSSNETTPREQRASTSHGSLTLHQTLYFDPPTFLPQEQQDRIRFAAQVLRDLRASKDRIPLAELLTQAIERTGYDASLLAEFLGSRKLANLHKLLDLSRQFDQGQSLTLKDFVTRLQTSVLEETDEEFATTLAESGNTIRLMSIHQSKGLEFPVVFVADIDRKGAPQSADAILHPQLGALVRPPEKFGERAENLALKIHHVLEKEADAEETIRLFYVGCTRAADYLILSTGLDEDRKSSSHSPWFELIQTRFDIQTGLLKGDPLLGSSPSAMANRETIPEILVHHVPCDAKPAESKQTKRIPLNQLAGIIIAAQPAAFPRSAAAFPRDASDIPAISVSRLEAIDDQLQGLHPSSRPKPSAAENDDEVDVDLATSLGIIVHAVLERVDFHNSKAWPDLLQTVVNQLPDYPGEDVVNQASMMLTSFFASSVVDELSAAKSIYREIDFLLPWPPQSTTDDKSNRSSGPETTIAGIIDVLVETETGWHVLDYKTGQFPTQTSDQSLLAPYELQLGVYAYAVEQWFGTAPAQLSLIVFRPEVRRITLSWSGEQWDRIRVRIEKAMGSLRAAATRE